MRLPFNIEAVKDFYTKEKYQPDIGRALLITFALLVPLVVGYGIGKPWWGIIPAITAQLMTSAKIRGTYGEKGLILISGTFALSFAAFIGTLSGAYFLTSVIFIGIVAGLASLARGIKDYGQVFGFTAVILFLISLYPPNTVSNALFHSFLVFSGGLWSTVLSLAKWPFRPDEPFYVDISKPWYISSTLMKSLTEPSFDKKKSEGYINQRENDLRIAINDVLPWLKKKRKGTAPLRREALKTVRAASRFGATALTLHSELSQFSSEKIPLDILLKIKKTADIVGSAAERITKALVSGKEAEFTKAKSAVEKANPALNNLLKSIEKELPETEGWIQLLHVVSLFESAIHYLEDAVVLIERMKKSSLGKAVKNEVDLTFRLKRLYKLVLLQLQPNSLLLQHSIRVMLMSSLGLSIYYLFDIPRGYWIVLTIMVLLQPEFATTWEKSRDRILGTLLGVILGSFLLISSFSFHFSFLVIVIAICSFFYIYYQAKNYKIAVIFVTIMLVAMLDTAENIDWHIAAFRLFSTIIGAVLSVAAAFLFWPEWESLNFPTRLSKAIKANRNYLVQIGFELRSKTGFHPRVIADRRKAEVENINLEDSLKRLKNEPPRVKGHLRNARRIVDINKKLTRELTAFASSLPEIKGNEDFFEAQEMIAFSANILEQLSLAIENKQVINISSAIKNQLQEMEIKIQSLTRNTFSEVNSYTLTLGTSLLPQEIVYSELRKILSLVTEMIEKIEESEKIAGV